MKEEIEKAIREKEKYIEDKIKSIQKTLREDENMDKSKG